MFSFYSDVIGLQFCNYELKPSTFFQLFFKSFLSIKTDTAWVSEIFASSEADKGYIVADLFSMMTEVVTNELHIPNLLTHMMSFTVRMYGSDILLPDKPYEPAVAKFVKQFIAVMTPMPLKEANKALESVISDHQLVKEILASYVEYDKTSKVIRMKSDWVEKLRKQKPNLDLVWYNLKEDSKYKQMIQENFPDMDLLEVTEPCSDLNKRLRNKLYDSSTVEHAVDLIAQMSHSAGIATLVRSFLKFLLMQLSSFKKGEDSEPELKSLIDGKLEDLLNCIEKQTGFTAVVDQARSKLSLIKVKYLNESQGIGLHMVAKVNSTDQDHKERVQSIFNKKKAKIMKKMAERKNIFMVGLETASDKVIQAISKTDDDIQCPITQEKLSNSRLYYMLGQMHYFNVTTV